MAHGQVVIVGAGILGLAHALEALSAGWGVTVFERDGRTLGASIRNFGALWPIGCAIGAEREQALYGVQRWKELAAEAGFWFKHSGALSLAYREEAWDVLQEFVRRHPDGEGFRLLSPADLIKQFPAANPLGLKGALHSAAEASVHPASALPALTQLVIERGGIVEFGKPVVKVHASSAELADGRQLEFDRLVIAAGKELRLLFPAELAAARVTRCRLQMMRTAPQPNDFQLGPLWTSDLSLCHYLAFAKCPSVLRLKSRIEAELPAVAKEGVHVLAAQHPDGSLVIGDSHEYAADFNPDTRTDVDELILDELQKFVRVPDLRIASRWTGCYLKSTAGQTEVVLHPRERVTLVAAMGGLGMTLSWGLAKKTVESWSTG